ncbi:MAG TPA: hypothetical protein VF538_12675 [Pyrinomonadaceae bacterium]|jgi:hypothetical protein
MKTGRTILPAALSLAVSLIAAAAAGSAQKDEWQGKPYQQWTKKEAQQVLDDSPWAQTQVRSGPMIDGSRTPDKIYTLRLRSALPVRQALLRMRQLNGKYDEMSDKKKAEFDEKSKALVECPACADNYVLSLFSPAQAEVTRLTLEKVKLYVRLMDERGRQRELVHFVPAKAPGDEIVFFFSKFDEKGEPLLTPASKSLVFTIDTSVLSMDTVIRRFEFDVSKMIRNGQVAF